MQHLTTGLAAAALLLATPLAAAGSAGQPASTPLAVTTVGINTAGLAPVGLTGIPRPAPSTSAETGGGWSEVYCLSCVGIAGYTLASGGTVMLPLLLANAEMVGTFGATCLYACRSLIKQLFS
jgi:hypothetical protein